MMRVLVATDAWHPQVNGVVRTLTSLARSALKLGVHIEFLSPDGLSHRSAADLSRMCGLRWRAAVKSLGGSSGCSRMRFTSRRKGLLALPCAAYCMRRDIPFATSYTTRFPEYISARLPDPGIVELRGAASVPCRGRGHHGLDALADG